MSKPQGSKSDKTLAAVLLVGGLLIGAGLGYVGHSASSATSTVTSTATGLSPAPVTTTSTAYFTTSTTQFITTTNTQFVTITTIVTSTSTTTVAPQGTVVALSGVTEVIPSGQKSIVLSPALSFPYDGNIVVTYTATNAVSISYTEGSTTIASPNAETGSGLILPVDAGSPQIMILNGSCPLVGSCPSITMTLSITYEYP